MHTTSEESMDRKNRESRSIDGAAEGMEESKDSKEVPDESPCATVDVLEDQSSRMPMRKILTVYFGIGGCG